MVCVRRPSDRQHFKTTPPLKSWSQFVPNFTYSIYSNQSCSGNVQLCFFVFIFIFLFFFFFCFNWMRTLVAMVTYSCHWPTIVKVEIVIYNCLTAATLSKVLQNCSAVLYVNYKFHTNHCIWFVAMATETCNLWKQYSKIFSSEAKRGWSWKFTEMFILFAFTKVVFLLPLLKCFRRCGNLKFP